MFAMMASNMALHYRLNFGYQPYIYSCDVSERITDVQKLYRADHDQLGMDVRKIFKW